MLIRGRASLQSLAEQREKLKGAQQKALDMLNLLGVSQSVVRRMQSRNATDRYIVYGGMAATTVFIYVCWRLTR
jgi:Golgi SNAP receptor complex protein 2